MEFEIKRYNENPPIKVLVSRKDYKNISRFKWHTNSNGYICSNTEGFLHRKIMNYPKNKVVDHINGNLKDNRRGNLRICSIKENIRNSKLSKNSKSGINGVSFRKDRNKFRSYIMVDKKQISLGSFLTIKEARDARLRADKKYFGVFRRKHNG